MMKTGLLITVLIVMLWLVYSARVETIRTQFPVCEQLQKTQGDKTRCYKTQWWWHSAI
ncbi:hypothetical protein [Methylophaga pinxianii]|uniref:hypothetical protein n=1 Tax=Methylophaga pinxianii TaxID=2881052 RepID=UPI001CF57175|nr:hypothetical protein [Methylophaga pinxianii]MCB2427955.1 hypothetical protein [Methylophaga pinxianii]UPH44445.1 hypothetical protein LGT42_007910 [Methylophaga pinxianii]